uniref:Putative ribonuclease H-like domain-containing protein n=1 Tax=Tanacetum cinerariifolium TaxID=118510 RepID=A0A6L2L4D4_TANCI|nr:putative ribonuclease H-like domain-containing protein [Tanacetum cinerariifolium]
MRIEQYFLMTDYSLREVILNGDSPAPTRVVEGVLQPVSPTTAEQKLARKNELKACGTLLMALPDKHWLKFNSHKDAKTLMEAIEKRFGGNTETKKVQKALLKQYLKIYEAEVKHSSSIGTTTQNLAFVSSSNTDSTTELVSATASVSAVYAKLHVSSLPNVDSLSNMAMLTMRARRFLQRTGKNLEANGPTSLGFDMSKVECYNCYRKEHFARECRSPKDSRRNGAAEPQRRSVLVETSTSNALVSQCDGVGSYDSSFQAEEEPANYALMAFLSSSSSSDNEVFPRAMFDCDDYFSLESDESWPPSSLYDRFQPSDGYHAVPPPYTGTFMPPKPDLVFNTTPTAVETDHYAFHVQLSPTKLEQDLSHTNRPTATIIEDWVSDSKDESETKAPQIVLSFVQSTEQVKSPRPSVQHVETSIPIAIPKLASPKPTSNGKRMNRKACFVCKSLDHLIKNGDYHEKKIAKPNARNHAHKGNHKQYAPLSHQNPQKHMVSATILTQSKLVSITVVRQVSDAVSKLKVTRPRHAKPIITKSNSPTRRYLPCSPSLKVSNSPPRVTTVKAPVVSAAQGLQGKREWRLKCTILDHVSRTTSASLTLKRSSMVDMLPLEVTQKVMCDKKNSVSFTDTNCLVLSPDFKLTDESQVLLRVPRENNMYNVNLKNIVPYRNLTFLFTKATLDESNLWHRRLGHINFKTMNKLVKGNLVRGLPTKVFENDNTCVACKKGKQHRASCKIYPVSSVNQPLYRLHMDLFGPTFVKSLNKKSYCLVVTDDYSRFTWVFFLATKDETSPILKTFITGLENQLSLKVKVIRSDNGTEFKNNDLNQFCGMKGIKREFSIPRTPQQNGIAERKNRTLIKAAGTMLADSLLPITFWAEAVNTACYVQNRVLVTKPHNKTPYELLHGRTPSIGFMRPFGCPVTILNTLDSLGKFDGKVDEGFLVRYSISSKTFRVFNSRTCIVQETLHVNFLENKPNVVGSGPTWLFDIDSLTKTMNYQPVTAGNQTNPSADDAFDGKEHDFDAKKPESEVNVSPSSSAQSMKQDDKTKKEAKGKSPVDSFTGYKDLSAEFEDYSDNSINEVNAAGTLVPTIRQISLDITNTFITAELEDITYSDDEDNVSVEADFNNLETSITVIPILTSRVHKNHLVTQIIGDLSLTTQTRSMTKVVKDQGGLSQMFNDDFHTCLQVKQKKNGIFISHDKYVDKILRKFRLTDIKLASTPIDTKKPLLKDPDGKDVDVHTYRSMIGSLMYLTSSRPDIMFAQAVVATSSTEAKHVATASCYAQVLWIQNQPLDYGDSPLLGVNTPRCDEDRLELMELMVFFLPKVEKVGIGVSAIDLQVNDVTRLQALVDKKKVVVTEAMIREALYLDDEDEQQVDEEGDADENVEEVNAGDAAEGDVSAAHGEVPTVQPIPLPSPQGRMIAKIDHDADVVLEDDKEVADEAKEVADAVKDVGYSLQDQGRTVVDVVTTAKLITEVVTAASETITTASVIITAAEAQVHAATTAVTLTAAPARVTAAPSRRRKGVVIKDPEEESTTFIIIPAETKSKDKGKGILVEEPKPLKKKQQIKQDEQYAKELQAELNKNIDWDEAIDHTEAQARKNMMLYLKNVAGFKMDYFKGMSYDDIRPIFEAKFNSNVAFLLKIKEQIKEDENRALKRLNETLAERATKRQKLDEEVEELKRHLQIVPNEDAAVYTEATPLARNVPVVDYQIIKLNNKPYYKIIRADDTHQLYTCSDLEDSEKCTWSNKGQRMEAIGIMWCVDHNIYIYPADLLVEMKYPLTRFTLDQMLNAVRLKVEEESEVSLELLRFT